MVFYVKAHSNVSVQLYQLMIKKTFMTYPVNRTHVFMVHIWKQTAL